MILQARWLRKKFLDFQSDWLADHADFPFAKDWADYLGVNEKTLSAYMNGHRIVPKEKAWVICERMNDYSLLNILDYPLPRSKRVPLESLPRDLRERLQNALMEIQSAIRERSIDTESDEAASVTRDILEKHGFIVNRISKDG